MRKDEIELISALVEGRLEDDLEARALIASSPELQAEYESQKKAHEALASAGTALLRDDERAMLHRDLWTALRAETRPSRVPWYYRWVPITAGLFVVVVVGALIVRDQGNTVEIEASGAAMDSVTTTMAASTGTTASSTGTTASAETLSEEPTTITTTAESTAGGSGDLDLDVRLFAETAKALRQEETGVALAAPSSAESATDLDECLDRADLNGVDVIGTVDSVTLAGISGITVPDDVSKSFIVAVSATDDVQTGIIFFVDSETCQVVYVDE